MAHRRMRIKFWKLTPKGNWIWAVLSMWTYSECHWTPVMAHSHEHGIYGKLLMRSVIWIDNWFTTKMMLWPFLYHSSGISTNTTFINSWISHNWSTTRVNKVMQTNSAQLRLSNKTHQVIWNLESYPLECILYSSWRLKRMLPFVLSVARNGRMVRYLMKNQEVCTKSIKVLNCL